MNVIHWVVLGIGILISIPMLMKNRHVERQEKEKFQDISGYVEQMLYSFKRHSKILSSLEDTQILFQKGSMKSCIMEGITYLQHANDSEQIYMNTFSKIEKKYNCEIVRKTHNFLVNVELKGGTYEDSIEILMEDRNKWVNRVLNAQNEKTIVKRNMTISTCLALLIVVAMKVMIPATIVGAQNPTIMGTITVVVVLINYYLWVYIQSKFSGSWMVEAKQWGKKEWERAYFYAHMDLSTSKRNQRIMYGIMMVMGSLIYLLTWNVMVVILSLLVLFVFMNRKSYIKKRALKELKREVTKVFPEWILGIALLLQTDNVQVSITKSIATAPIVLKKELTDLIEKIEEDPLGLLPYIEFYKMLEINEVQSAMKMLYAMSQYGAKDLSNQIFSLLERNALLQDQSEKIRMEDYLAGMSMFILLPMVISSFKLLTDMIFVILGLLNFTSGVF